MSTQPIADDFRTVLSIDPLLDFWREKVAPNCPYMADMFTVFEKQIQETPELQGDIDDPEGAARHTNILSPLMSVAFPSSTWETEVAGAFKPFQHRTIYCTPAYRSLLLDDDGLGRVVAGGDARRPGRARTRRGRRCRNGRRRVDRQDGQPDHQGESRQGHDRGDAGHRARGEAACRVRPAGHCS